MRKVNRISLALIAGLIGSAFTVQAAPISGLFNITGSVRVTATGLIDFLADPGPPSMLNNGFKVVPPETGTFSGLEGTRGTLVDLQLGAPFPVMSWLSLQALPTFSFTLTSIDPGVFASGACALPEAPGQTCTPPPPAPGIPSPFSFVNQGVTGGPQLPIVTGSTVGFTLNGTVTDPSGPVSNFTAIFTSQFIGQSYQDVLAMFAQNGFVEASYSATIQASPMPGVPQIPEPGTASLLLGGVAALVGLRFAKRCNA